jgi:DNA-binding GntR family transcriptional regulator
LGKEEETPSGGQLKTIEGFVSFQEKVYQALRETILAGSLRPGDPLVERELAAQLGVSRTPVREALHKLEQEGLVVRDAWKQSIVAIPTPDDAEQVLYIRMAFELLSLDLIRTEVPPGVIQEMKSLFQSFSDEGPGTSEAYRRYLDADKRFHAMIVDLCGRPLIIDEYKQWQDLTHWYRFLELKRRELSVSVNEHLLIIDRLESGDIEGAKNGLKEHLFRAAELYREGLSQQHVERAAPDA